MDRTPCKNHVPALAVPIVFRGSQDAFVLYDAHESGEGVDTEDWQRRTCVDCALAIKSGTPRLHARKVRASGIASPKRMPQRAFGQIAHRSSRGFRDPAPRLPDSATSLVAWELHAGGVCPFPHQLAAVSTFRWVAPGLGRS
jgi:hypothetical protein